jgi:triphosphoribosyl-dephospho-CoA synthase
MHPWEIGYCAQLSCALEAACPKPGNVNRYHDFRDTSLEHYLASAVAVGRTMTKAAEAGHRHADQEEHHKIGIGRLILEAVLETRRWHTGRNTNLGLVALLIPMCASYGSAARHRETNDENVRKTLDSIVKSTTVDDARSFFRAIRQARPGGLGNHRDLDVRDPGSDRVIQEKGMNLYSVLKLSSYDSIARELTDKMRVTYDIGYPAILEEYERTGSLREGILYGYMKILSQVPDSLIARKKGPEAAKKVAEEAERLLEAGLPPDEMDAFDKMLRAEGNAFNPGTTADLTASSLMVCILKGARP